MSVVVDTVTGATNCCCVATGCTICGGTVDFSALVAVMVVTFTGTGCGGTNLSGTNTVYSGTQTVGGNSYYLWSSENQTAGCPTGYVAKFRCDTGGIVAIFEVSDLGPLAPGGNSIACGDCSSSNALSNPLSATTSGPVCSGTTFVSQQWVINLGSFGTWTVTVVKP